MMVLLPYYFHAVFMLTPACDIRVKAESDFWKEKMKNVVQIMEKHNRKLSVKGSDQYWVAWFREFMRDFRVWVS